MNVSATQSRQPWEMIPVIKRSVEAFSKQQPPTLEEMRAQSRRSRELRERMENAKPSSSGRFETAA